MQGPRTQRWLSYLTDLLLGLVAGLAGSLLAVALRPAVPDELVARGFAQLLAALVIGLVAGVVGRGWSSAVGLWAGLALAAAGGRALPAPGLFGLAPLVTALVVATAGYTLARAADPLAGTSGRRRGA